MTGSFDGRDKHALVLRASSRYTLWDDAALFRNKALEPFFVLVVNEDILIVTETTRPFFSLLLKVP